MVNNRFVLGVVFFSAMFTGCQTEDQEFSEPPIVWDVMCPTGFGAPPAEGNTSYYCVISVNPHEWYLDHCMVPDPTDFYCPLIEAKYCVPGDFASEICSED